MLFPISAVSMLASLLIIVLCCFIMARFRQIFDKLKIPIAIIAVLGGLTIYTLGYIPSEEIDKLETDGSTMTQSDTLRISSVALRAIFSTCRIFVLENDFADVNESLKTNGFYVLGFTSVHTLGIMLTVMTVLSAFGIKFLSRLQLILARPRQVYIFLGLNAATESLIKSIRKSKEGRCCIVIESLKERDDDAEIVKKLREDRFILIDRDWEELTSLLKSGIPVRMFSKEVHVFALSNEDSKNVKAALNLLNQAKADKISDDKLHFYLSSSDDGIEKIFEAENHRNGTSYDFKIYNLADLTARQLFNSFPIHNYVEVDKQTARATSDFTIFIAGLGYTGIEILRKSIYLGQYVGGSYRAIVTDEGITRKKGFLYNKYPELKKHYSIDAYEAQPGSEAFFDILEMNLKDIRYIVVAQENDRINVETAIEVQRLVRRARLPHDVLIAVHIRQHEEFEHLEGSDILPNVRFFGRISELFTENIIINESMDRMARKMNALFNEIYHISPADNWGKLDAFTKESNRSAASNIAAKLHLLGLEMAEKSDNHEKTGNPKKTVELEKLLIGEKLANLGMQEHLRWNAFHFASGWTTWNLKDTGKAKKAKDLPNRRHACLVSWEELEDVTRHFNQNPSYQELDFEQVRNIPRILDYAGYNVVESEDNAI